MRELAGSLFDPVAPPTFPPRFRSVPPLPFSLSTTLPRITFRTMDKYDATHVDPQEEKASGSDDHLAAHDPLSVSEVTHQLPWTAVRVPPPQQSRLPPLNLTLSGQPSLLARCGPSPTPALKYEKLPSSDHRGTGLTLPSSRLNRLRVSSGRAPSSSRYQSQATH